MLRTYHVLNKHIRIPTCISMLMKRIKIKGRHTCMLSSCLVEEHFFLTSLFRYHLSDWRYIHRLTSQRKLIWSFISLSLSSSGMLCYPRMCMYGMSARVCNACSNRLPQCNVKTTDTRCPGLAFPRRAHAINHRGGKTDGE